MTLFLTLQRFLVSFCLCALFINLVGFQGARAATPKLAPEITPKIDQSKVKMASPPPPLVFKKPPPQLVIVPGAKPGKVIELALTGGQAPVHVTIDAGANSQLFSVARGNLGQMSEKANYLAAAEQLTGIRFEGVAANSQLSAQIPVTVRATDGLGRTASVNFNVIPVAPRLRVGSSLAAFPRQAVTESIFVDGLPPGSVCS